MVGSDIQLIRKRKYFQLRFLGLRRTFYKRNQTILRVSLIDPSCTLNPINYLSSVEPRKAWLDWMFYILERKPNSIHDGSGYAIMEPGGSDGSIASANSIDKCH